MKQEVIYALVLISVVVVAMCMWRNRSTKRNAQASEDFADTLGMMESQRHSYDTCISNCHRRHGAHFKNTGSWMQLLCERQCNKEGDEGIRTVKSDSHPDDHNRHSSECAAAPDQEECHCHKEISEWCQYTYCSFSKNPEKCRSSCERINAYKCKSGLNWSWRP